MNLQWIAACAAVVIVLLAASPFISDEAPTHSATASQPGTKPVAQAVGVAQVSTASGEIAAEDRVADAGDVSEWSRAKNESIQAVGAISEATARTASEAWEATKSASSKAWGATKTGAQGATEATTATTSDAWQATKSGASQAAGATAESASAAWQATKSATQGWWSGLRSATMGEAKASDHQDNDSPDGAHTTNQN